ncbi:MULTISPECIES: DUF2267 domain-containing protein [unclassified Rhodococcus (in: high G+C Gram-positive bacteria)]|uniref:DUF2267 domain-containing protein n=1 Tax=unclassified Rhodococcus (in: high G+C Gram-positive bacteria) TaxID=192944 RepID=UPI0020785BF5|nr:MULTISPECIES: DUF2267 domain-containing protein [unclassified Rhodococcus (in: high G+C Gram-positive bacteria)]
MMDDTEFLSRVREYGEYDSLGEATRVTTVVLRKLGARLTPGKVRALAAQLPPLARNALGPIEDGRSAPDFGVEEFRHRIAQALDAHPATAEWDTSAVLATVAQAVDDDCLRTVLGSLPEGFAPLFGRPETV